MDLGVSPNPSSGQVKLQFELEDEGDCEIRIMDANGQSVFNQNMTGFSGVYSNQIDLGSQPAGLYFISISQGGKGKVLRLVKN